MLEGLKLWFHMTCHERGTPLKYIVLWGLGGLRLKFKVEKNNFKSQSLDKNKISWKVRIGKNICKRMG